MWISSCLRSRTSNRGRRRPHRPAVLRFRPRLEVLEERTLLSSGLPLVQVSDPSPLPPPASTTGLSVNSEVEPQLAVDPTNPAHAVAIWQQDRYAKVGGARALVVSVTNNANDRNGATWTTPEAIPGFDSTEPAGAGFQRYTDPWVSFAPNGTIYAAAIGLDPSRPCPNPTAILVSESTDGGNSWSTPQKLIETTAAPGTDQCQLANDKEMVVADPHDSTGQTAYVIWDQLQMPSNSPNTDLFAAHAFAFRENAMFCYTTNGGATWSAPRDLTNFLSNHSAFGNEIVVEPATSGGALVDVFTYGNGSGKQAPQADQNVLGVLRSTDHGATWSNVLTGPAIEAIPVTDPNTGAPVRSGEPLTSVAVDPNNGNIYAVWADGRFSGFTHDDIVFSMSKDGGLTWSDPIKVNQTPTNIPAGDQQAFTPTVAVNSDGTVAVSYYDFRNNTGGPGLPTDYWLVQGNPAGAEGLTNPANWGNEVRLTNASFNMENAAPTSEGYFLGDYQGLAAAGNNFYALFAQAGSSSSDPSNIWFRDPPPAATPPASGPALTGSANLPTLNAPTTNSVAPEQPTLTTFLMSMLEVATSDWDSLATSLTKDWQAMWTDLVDAILVDAGSWLHNDMLTSLAQQWESQAG